MTSFSDLGLIGPLLQALNAEGYTQPTPIQAQAIPILLQGRDLLGIAQTGTGKTAAFALPILQHLAAHPKPAARKSCRVLVLSPTRELARQIGDSFRTYGRFMKLNVSVVFGGMPPMPQARQLQNGVDVLVATPGRLLDHINQRNVDLGSTEIFVLDEADQMLDLGFIVPIRKLVRALPHKRQNLFFSATMPAEIGKLAAELLRDPAEVSVAPVATTAERVNQRVIHIDTSGKRGLLIELLGDPAMARVLVFTRTKHGANKVGQALAAAGQVAEVIHGNKSQSQRVRALESFRAGRTRLLVATDIAARGIDIDGISHVVNFDLPEVPESYVHRIGRTARAGATGDAVAFCAPEERHLLRAIEKLTRLQIPSSDRVGARPQDGAEPKPMGARSPAPHRRGHEGHKPSRPHHETRGDHGHRAKEGHRKGEPQRQGEGRPRQGEAPRGHEQSRHEPVRYETGRQEPGRQEAGRREAPRHDGADARGSRPAKVGFKGKPQGHSPKPRSAGGHSGKGSSANGHSGHGHSQQGRPQQARPQQARPQQDRKSGAPSRNTSR